MKIRIRELRKSFPANRHSSLAVLDGVDFEVEDGKFVTLLGPSGCGKTTILKIIARIEKPDGGSVQTEPDSSDGMPIVWQEHRLFPWRTVSRNVGLPLELRNFGRGEVKKKVADLLLAMGLQEFSEYYPWQISGGMAQRVAIARALASDSSCLLMDEPFASVDYQTKQDLVRQVRDLHERHQLTILYVTHDIRDAIQLSDYIVVLSNRPSRVQEIVRPTAADVRHSDAEEHIWSLLKRPRLVPD
jgi:ABC-type nitrate/sulfonate/bicarbonate transport system ATPase subunit